MTIKKTINNYVTLKLLSQIITRPPLRYVMPDTDPPFIIYFSFLKLKKKNKQRCTPSHDTSTHVFKQLNPIVMFK